MKGELIISQKHTHVIKSASDCKKIGSKYENILVVYSFTTKDFNMKHTYIGISQNLTNRLEVNYFQGKKLYKHYGFFYLFCNENGEMKNLLFNVHIILPTFQFLYLKANKECSLEVLYILKYFSELQAGIYD